MADPDAVTEIGRLPLAEEVPRILRRRTTRRVRVAVTTATEAQTVEALLRHRRVAIERIPLGHEVEAPPPVRQEGDTLVIPVVEERLVLVRRLVLAEEIRMRLHTEEEAVTLPVALRRQSVAVESLVAGEDVRPVPNDSSHAGDHPMTQRTLIAMFDSRAEAERAGEALRGLNVRASGVTVHDSDGSWTPEEDRDLWQEGFRRGAALVRGEVAEEDLELAMDAMEAAGAVDLETRAQEWRAQGWTGGAASAAPKATAAHAPGMQAGGMQAGGRSTGATASRGGTANENDVMGEGARRPAGGGEAIPLAEERLRVGKRVAHAGRVRVRTYAVETPVEEQVRLREEHVRVERRATDRPAAQGEDLFKDRVIEAEESSEEAVVRKETRVTGEVVVNKEATERTETVRDTVRRTEVEVDESQAANDPKRRGGKGAA